MLLIRQAQLKALGEARLAEFEARMVAHHQQYFPEWSDSLGTEALADFVRHGINRARIHGFQVELDLARYLHVMQKLGKHFDEDPDIPWARPLLKSKLPTDEKMDRLRDATDYHLEARRIRNG